MNKKNTCPICEKETELTASNAYRPFCSNRCRLIDLGEWINESYSMSDETTDENNIEIEVIRKH